MCEVDLEKIKLSFPNKPGRKEFLVDACIVPLVKALNTAGIFTDASCCGHGNRPGTIFLMDGRMLLIFPEEGGRAFDSVFTCPINLPNCPKWNRRR